MIGTWLVIVVAALLALPWLLIVVLKWVVAPIRIHGKSSVSLAPRFEPTRAERLTPEMRDFMAGALRALAAEGFRVVANLTLPNAVPDAWVAQAMLVNPRTGDLGSLLVTRAKGHRSMLTAVQTRFADGSALVTMFSREIGFAPPDPSKRTQVFARARDARALCEAHRRRLARLGLAGRPRADPPPPGGEVEFCDAEWAHELRRLERIGYYRRDAAAGVARLTWKGAFLTAWKLGEPVKSWRLRRRERQARRVWRELGMDRWQAPPPPAEAPPDAPARALAVEAAPDGTAAAAEPARRTPPPPIPVPAAAPAAELRYETTLPEGEIRQEWSGDALTVRAGMPTAGRALRRRWPNFVGAAFWGLNLAFWVFALWRMRRTYARFPGLAPSPLSFLTAWFVWVVVALLLFEAYKIVRAVLTARGTLVLTATPAGLSWRNLPAWRHAGHVPRDEIDGLVVHLHTIGLRKTYRLALRRRGGGAAAGRGRGLLSGRDKAALERVRAALCRAMGMEADDPPPDEGGAAG